MIDAVRCGHFRKHGFDASVDLAEALAGKLIGQPSAIETIVPYVRMHQANLAPVGRPVGVFLLLGPTGTGKTRTVEALAEALHGSDRKLLRIDCGEFQMEHEVARLIGAPPGYLGHRETQPMVTQQKLNSVTSEHSNLSLVLFDEIEKAAPSLGRLLLGVLDKGTLHLGDNTIVNFENSLIFLTSNLGARDMFLEIRPAFGFQFALPVDSSSLNQKLERIGVGAVRKKFPPEFVNQIDAMIGYQPLDGNSLAAILDQQLDEFQNHVSARLGVNEFAIDVPESSRQFLLRTGTSAEYGARELKRTLHRQLIQPMAAMVAGGKIAPGCTVRVSYSEETRGLELIPGVENQELPIESENTNSSHFRRRGPRRVRPDQDSLRLSA